MLSCYIIAKGDTLEFQCQAVVETFSESTYLMNIWRERIQHDYLRREDLLSLVPNDNCLITPKDSFGVIK